VFASEVVVGVGERGVSFGAGWVQFQRLQKVGYRFPARALARAENAALPVGVGE
jgi:hypothetical protein